MAETHSITVDLLDGTEPRWVCSCGDFNHPPTMEGAFRDAASHWWMAHNHEGPGNPLASEPEPCLACLDGDCQNCHAEPYRQFLTPGACSCREARHAKEVR